jgi:hypothetical protein
MKQACSSFKRSTRINNSTTLGSSKSTWRKSSWLSLCRMQISCPLSSSCNCKNCSRPSGKRMSNPRKRCSIQISTASWLKTLPRLSSDYLTWVTRQASLQDTELRRGAKRTKTHLSASCARNASMKLFCAIVTTRQRQKPASDKPNKLPPTNK